MARKEMNRTSAAATSKTVALSAIFGALAIFCTQLFIPLFFGNPNLGSTPVTIAAVLCPLPVGVASGIVKGLGASLWTGQPFIEMPAGIGDAIMAAFTHSIAKRWKKVHAASLGQLSRYVFTSGMIALYIGLVASIGATSGPEATVFRGLVARYPWFSQSMSFLPKVVANILVIWVAISFPAVTLSIIANTFASVLVIGLAGKRIRDMLLRWGMS